MSEDSHRKNRACMKRPKRSSNTLRDDMMLLEVQFALFAWSSHEESLFHDLLRPCDHATLRTTDQQQH